MLVERQSRLIGEQAERIEALQVEVAELRRRLGRNSRNCSPPPSADGGGAALDPSAQRAPPG